MDTAQDSQASENKAAWYQGGLFIYRNGHSCCRVAVAGPTCTASLATLASATNEPTTLKSASAILGLFIPILLGAAVLAAGGGNPEKGLRLAERWCAACHVVSPSQREATSDALPFAAIGERPGFNAEQLAYFLMEPHPRMPSMEGTFPAVHGTLCKVEFRLVLRLVPGELNRIG